MADPVGIVCTVFDCLKAIPCFRDPLTERFYFFWERKQNLDTLDGDVRSLQAVMSEVEQKYEGKVVRKPMEISDWLQKAKKINDLNFRGRIREDCCGPPCYFWSQYKEGKKLVESIKMVKPLIEEGNKLLKLKKDDVVGYLLESRKLVGKTGSNAEEIKQYVMGREVGTIGVYGMRGSGKTAVVSEVNNRILEDYKSCASEDSNNKVDDHFDKVIWVTVENTGPTQRIVYTLQKAIAEELQINHFPQGRAATLANALKKRRFLIVLDKVWTELSLEAIGIPRPTKNNGCKVIIISRSREVCSDIHFDRKVEISLLSDIESQELFETKAGIMLSELGDDTRATAQEMIHECDGIPKAVISLAQNLRELMFSDAGDVDSLWKTAFTKLKNYPPFLKEMNKTAFARVKYSYDMLKKQAQRCFLIYCALYTSGHEIEKRELVENWFSEGLLDTRKRDGRIEDMIQAKEILDELIGARLLEIENQEGGKEYIKMRNLVRHMAVHLTKMSPDQFLIKTGEKLSDFPSQGEYWSEEPKFPKLSTSLLQHNPITHLQLQRNRSFESVLEAQTRKRESTMEEAPIACGVLSRTVGRTDTEDSGNPLKNLSKNLILPITAAVMTVGTAGFLFYHVSAKRRDKETYRKDKRDQLEMPKETKKPESDSAGKMKK